MNTPRIGSPVTLGGRAVKGPRRQAGMTALGFLLLACLVGVVALAGIKLTPLYITNFKLSKVLDDVQSEFDGAGATAGAIRTAISRRFDIEDIRLPPDNLTINQVRNGYEVRIQYDNRTHYIANIWLLVEFDKQVEIRR